MPRTSNKMSVIEPNKNKEGTASIFKNTSCTPNKMMKAMNISVLTINNCIGKITFNFFSDKISVIMNGCRVYHSICKFIVKLQKLLEMNELDDSFKRSILALNAECTVKPKSCVQEQKEIHNKNNFMVELMAGKVVLDRIRYCNVYRKQIIQLETNAMSNITLWSLESYRIVYEIMVRIFNTERQLRCSDEFIPNPVQENYTYIVKFFTRTELWRVILTWFFYEKFLLIESKSPNPQSSQNDKDMNHKIENDCDILKLHSLLASTITLNLEKFHEDRICFDSSNIFLSLTELKKSVASKFDFKPSKVIHVIIEIKYISKAFHDGFQVASKNIENIKNITTVQDELEEVDQSIIEKMEKLSCGNSGLVLKCMDVVVATR